MRIVGSMSPAKAFRATAFTSFATNTFPFSITWQLIWFCMVLTTYNVETVHAQRLHILILIHIHITSPITPYHPNITCVSPLEAIVAKLAICSGIMLTSAISLSSICKTFSQKHIHGNCRMFYFHIHLFHIECKLLSTGHLRSWKYFFGGLNLSVEYCLCAGQSLLRGRMLENECWRY